MNDRATSSETGGKAVAVVDIGLNSAYTPGAGVNNSIVTAYRTAAEILTNRYASNVSVVAAPGIRDTAVTNYVSTLVQNYGFALYLMDIPGYDYNGSRLFDGGSEHPDVQQTGNKFTSRKLNNNFVAVYFPDISMQDQGGTSRKIKVPSSVAALAAIGYNDAVSHPWYAPAGFNRGALNFVSTTAVRLNSADRDFLYDNRINPITSFPGTGYVIFGQKTLQVGKSALDRVNVRRLVNEVKRVVSNIASTFLFEQNNAATRSAFVSQVNPALALVQAQQGIEGFRVIVDDTNNTQTDVIANRLNGRVIIIPTRAVEFISIDFIVTDNGASFV
jgi:phage tail sheath protein FI